MSREMWDVERLTREGHATFNVGTVVYYTVARKCSNCGHLTRTAHIRGTEAPPSAECPTCGLEYARLKHRFNG